MLASTIQETKTTNHRPHPSPSPGPAGGNAGDHDQKKGNYSVWVPCDFSEPQQCVKTNPRPAPTTVFHSSHTSKLMRISVVLTRDQPKRIGRSSTVPLVNTHSRPPLRQPSDGVCSLERR